MIAVRPGALYHLVCLLCSLFVLTACSNEKSQQLDGIPITFNLKLIASSHSQEDQVKLNTVADKLNSSVKIRLREGFEKDLSNVFRYSYELYKAIATFKGTIVVQFDDSVQGYLFDEHNLYKTNKYVLNVIDNFTSNLLNVIIGRLNKEHSNLFILKNSSEKELVGNNMLDFIEFIITNRWSYLIKCLIDITEPGSILNNPNRFSTEACLDDSGWISQRQEIIKESWRKMIQLFNKESFHNALKKHLVKTKKQDQLTSCSDITKHQLFSKEVADQVSTNIKTYNGEIKFSLLANVSDGIFGATKLCGISRYGQNNEIFINQQIIDSVNNNVMRVMEDRDEETRKEIIFGTLVHEFFHLIGFNDPTSTPFLNTMCNIPIDLDSLDLTKIKANGTILYLGSGSIKLLGGQKKETLNNKESFRLEKGVTYDVTVTNTVNGKVVPRGKILVPDGTEINGASKSIKNDDENIYLNTDWAVLIGQCVAQIHYRDL